jgi:hypothetical protein
VWGVVVSKEDALVFGIAGGICWLAVTAFYGAFAGVLLESSFWFYALNAALAAGAMLAAFCFTARLRGVSRRKRLFPALAFMLPGLIGGIVAFFNLDEVFPQLEAVSRGRYAAFLIVGYTVLIGLAMERPAARPRSAALDHPDADPLALPGTALDQ